MYITQARVGMHKQDIETPAFLIDLPAMEHNLALMSDFFAGRKAKLRPHFKSHKLPPLAHKQIAAGAVGITCAKLGEAEALAQAGIRDILIANQIVGPSKIARLMALARHTDIMVAVDNAENVRALSDAVVAAGVQPRVLVEVDNGMLRCGVQPGRPALELARLVEQAVGLRFYGIHSYEGHAVNITPAEERKKVAESSLHLALETRKLLEDEGLEVRILSAGGTGTYNVTGCLEGVDEIQAGSYLLMDSNYASVTPEFHIAASILTTVISKPKSSVIIVDAGLKTVTTELGLPGLKDLPGKLFDTSEEYLNFEVGAAADQVSVGDKIELIPTHTCTTANLYDAAYGIRDDRVETIWEIAGRGKST